MFNRILAMIFSINIKEMLVARDKILMKEKNNFLLIKTIHMMLTEGIHINQVIQ